MIAPFGNVGSCANAPLGMRSGGRADSQYFERLPAGQTLLEETLTWWDYCRQSRK